MRENDDLDNLLDAALATYSDKSVPGLEERILSRTVGDAVPGRLSLAKDWKRGVASAFRWRTWVPATAVLLAAAILPFYIRQARHAGSPTAIERSPSSLSTPAHRTPEEMIAKAPPDLPTPRTHQRLPLLGSMLTSVRKQSEPLPKQEVFPTPTPLGPQEQALKSLVNGNPEEVRQSMADAAKNAAEPIQIVALKIPPLSPPDHGGN